MEKKVEIIKKRMHELKEQRVSSDELKEIDKEIVEVLRNGYIPVCIQKRSANKKGHKLQKELERKFDELMGGIIEEHNCLEEVDIICEFIKLCQNNKYEFYNSRTFMNFLMLSPINDFPYVKEYNVKGNLKKRLRYINDNYLITNAASSFCLINAMRLNRLRYAEKISDLFDEYAEEYDASKIENYLEQKKVLTKEEFWDFAKEINRYKISEKLLSKEICEYIICESMNPKSQLFLDSDFWSGLKCCVFCDYLTHEQIEGCKEKDYLNYTLVLENANGEYNSFKKTICLDPYYIWKFSGENIKALSTLFHEFEHLKQRKTIQNGDIGRLHYDMIKEGMLARQIIDFKKSRELLLFSEMEARRLGFENMIAFLKRKKINLKSLKIKSKMSVKNISVFESIEELEHDYRNCMFEKFFGRKRFSTNRRLSKIFVRNPDLLKERPILFFEFNEDGTQKTIKEVLGKINIELSEGNLSKEDAISILKSNLFDSIWVNANTYKRRIQSVLEFKYSSEAIEKVCIEAVKEKIKEILIVLESPRKLKNKTEICSILRKYI